MKLQILNTMVFTLHLSQFITWLSSHVLFSGASVVRGVTLEHRTEQENSCWEDDTSFKKTAIVFRPGCRWSPKCRYLDYKSGHNINSTPDLSLTLSVCQAERETGAGRRRELWQITMVIDCWQKKGGEEKQGRLMENERWERNELIDLQHK